MSKFYIDGSNNYIGAFDGAQPPNGSIEVPSAPPHARCKWNPANSTWNAVTLNISEKVGPEVEKQLINLAFAMCDFAVRGDKTAITVIDNKLQQLKNS
jgi:hypothetical protein